MLRQGEILTLSDNKKYTVVATTIIENISYVYLIEQDDYTNVIFCKNDGDNLEEVIQPELIEQLMIEFKNKLNQ